MEKTVKGLEGLAAVWGVEPTEAAISKAVYKGTHCGAWIDFFDGGVRVGSIVEGADFGTKVYTVKFPCEEDDIHIALQLVEDEAADIWAVVNG